MSPPTDSPQEQRDAHFMELALSQAEAAVAMGQTPFGAVVLDSEGRLVGEGHNRVRADLDRALKIIAAFPWAKAEARTAMERSP